MVESLETNDDAKRRGQDLETSTNLRRRGREGVRVNLGEANERRQTGIGFGTYQGESHRLWFMEKARVIDENA